MENFVVKFLDVERPTPPRVVRARTEPSADLTNRSRRSTYSLEPRDAFFDHPFSAHWAVDKEGRLVLTWTTGFQVVTIRSETAFSLDGATVSAKVFEANDTFPQREAGSAMLTPVQCPLIVALDNARDAARSVDAVGR
jgi:hypothetical protein